MKQSTLPFKQRKYRWLVYLAYRGEKDGTFVNADAYTKKQALFSASKLGRRGYDEEHSEAKIVGQALS